MRCFRGIENRAESPRSKHRDNELLRRNNGTSVIPGVIFPGIFIATLDTLLYHFHFISRINYRVALIGTPFARQITLDR